MFVMVTRHGTPIAVEFLRTSGGGEGRVAWGGVVLDEGRLFWDNIPLWYNIALQLLRKVERRRRARTTIRLDPADGPSALESIVTSRSSLPARLSRSKRLELIRKAVWGVRDRRGVSTPTGL